MDERRRYLAQLLELGEREIVLGRPVTWAPAAALPPSVTPRPSVAPPPSVTPPLSVAPQPSVAGREAARERAPAGIVADAPVSADLFTADPMAHLASLDALAAAVRECRKCPLGASRAQAVPGEGDARARLVVVGEAPGAREDETGRPFVGRAGQLLTDILAAIRLGRDEVFICNVLKCRPPDNRDPEPLEVSACSPYLHRQLELIRPRVILAMGRPAAHALLGSNASLAELRGKVHRYRGVPVIVTYHPAALLRNPHWKRPTWDDVRLARRIYDGEVA